MNLNKIIKQVKDALEKDYPVTIIWQEQPLSCNRVVLDGNDILFFVNDFPEHLTISDIDGIFIGKKIYST